MLFNSLDFAIFLPIVFLLYICLNHRAQNIWLLGASWLFYGWWDYRFLSLLVISTIVDFHCGRAIAKCDNGHLRKRFLILSLVSNLGILGFFKYYGFFVESAVAVLDQLGFNASVPILQVVLPMGISFYTFQTMSYTIDIYRKKLKPCNDLVTFALFVGYFPQLVAGPIERASQLLPQLAKKRQVTMFDLREGGLLILIGLFKKVAVADALAPLVEVRFQSPELCSGPDLIFASYLFAIQIYGDFSGYSDIARGTSRLLGIHLMVNFNQPYFSASITEFWRRWHISLSSWLRDYLYIPLGGNRHGTLMAYRNLFITMLLGGLWHGAAWTFVVWGGLHGLYLTVHKIMIRMRPPPDFISLRTIFLWPFKMIFTFHLVCLTWIFFRSDSFAGAWIILTRIASWSADYSIKPISWGSTQLCVLLVGLLLIDLLQQISRSHLAIGRLWWPIRGIAYASMVIGILGFGGIDAEVPFIYFQF